MRGLFLLSLRSSQKNNRAVHRTTLCVAERGGFEDFSKSGNVEKSRKE
jgi:hypothetical protein